MTYLKFLLTFHALFLFAHPFAFGQLTSNREGKPDRSFGDNGFAFIYPDRINVMSTAGAMVQADGKCIWVHTATVSPFRILLARQLENGGIDKSFGENGTKIINMPGAGWAIAMAVQSDGKLLVAGFLNSDSDIFKNDFYVLRLLPDGTPDATFGNAGVVMMDFAPVGSKLISNDRATSILEQPDGKIVVAGISDQFIVSPGRASTYALLARLNMDGRLDNTFGTGGVSKELIGSNHTNGFSDSLRISFQKDGKILAGATVPQEIPSSPGNYSDRDIVLRYLSNGVLDPAFADDGVIDVTARYGFACCTIKEISKGKIMVLTSEALISLTPQGAYDPTFGNNGNASLGPGWYPLDFNIAQDNKIIVSRTAGRNLVPGGVRTLGQWQRFWPDGTPDIRFGQGGKTIIDLGNQDLYLAQFKIVKDKYLIVRGAVGLPPTQYNFFVGRFFATRKP